MQHENLERTIETAGITALAVASKTPFKTAFLATIGIGLARLLLFAGVVSIFTLAITICSKVLS